MTFRKILVALDRLFDAQAVFEQAINIAKNDASTLLLVSYLPWKPSARSEAESTFNATPAFSRAGLELDALKMELERAQEMLRGYQAEAKALGLKASVRCDVGNPSEMICAKAKDWGVDLIIMGRQDRKGLTELVLGRVSNDVLHHAHCSVLVIQGA
ncbi:MAG: universal stress protein [Synechococcales cyanobacterium RU_4_20]|nr:universal stress protein [Synechococcales cyanobacterium RU_4_20]NJR71183.1 universal stress protein [Synechococcales cyanobacterium CRU_2_2]